MSGQPEVGALSAPEASAAPRRLRVAAVGISIDEICGVRDHAKLLAGALEAQGVSCSLHWLQRTRGSLRSERAQIESWAQGLTVELEAAGAEAVLLHYSVFAYSHKGIPLFVGRVLAACRQARLPIVTVLHEYAYPWRRDGLAGAVWAVSQRAWLIGVMRVSAAAVVTTGLRADWLRSRPWLARQPIEVVPVFSNLPPASAAASDPDRAPGVVGLFGYGYNEATAALVLDALRLLRGRALPLRLVLLGAPGERSPAGERWARLARARGVREALSFSGALPAQELSDRLAACEILLFADPIGPTSRKTTLAASLSAGRPVLALDGPQRWPELIAAEAARVVEPSAEALATALGELLADEQLRESLGARGREFAERVGLARAARVVAELLARVLAQVGARAGSQAERAL